MKKFCFCLISLTFFFFVSSPLPPNFNIEEALRQQEIRDKQNPLKNYDMPNILLFRFSPPYVNEIRYYSRIIQEFLRTMGIEINILNTKKNQMLATIPPFKYFDRDMVVKHFDGILEAIDMGDFTKGH